MKLTKHLKDRVQSDGSVVTDLHVWRLGPGHLGAIVSVNPPANASSMGEGRNQAYYREKIKGFRALSHTTIEIGH